MKNKGFTLIETLATLIILSILFMIAVPSITTLVNRVNENRIKKDAETFIQLAKHYVEKHIEFERGTILLKKDCDDNLCIDMNKLSDEYEEGKVTVSGCGFILSSDENEEEEYIYNCSKYEVVLKKGKLNAKGEEGSINVEK